MYKLVKKVHTHKRWENIGIKQQKKNCATPNGTQIQTDYSLNLFSHFNLYILSALLWQKTVLRMPTKRQWQKAVR